MYIQYYPLDYTTLENAGVKPKTGILRNGVYAKKVPFQLKIHLFGPQLPFGLFLDTWDRILKESMDSEKVPFQLKSGLLSWKGTFSSSILSVRIRSQASILSIGIRPLHSEIADEPPFRSCLCLVCFRFHCPWEVVLPEMKRYLFSHCSITWEKS